jgi:hypothetical protein
VQNIKEKEWKGWGRSPQQSLFSYIKEEGAKNKGRNRISVEGKCAT